MRSDRNRSGSLTIYDVCKGIELTFLDLMNSISCMSWKWDSPSFIASSVDTSSNTRKVFLKAGRSAAVYERRQQRPSPCACDPGTFTEDAPFSPLRTGFRREHNTVPDVSPVANTLSHRFTAVPQSGNIIHTTLSDCAVIQDRNTAHISH